MLWTLNTAYCSFHQTTSCPCCSCDTQVVFASDVGSPPSASGLTYHLILSVKRESGESLGLGDEIENAATCSDESGTLGTEKA